MEAVSVACEHIARSGGFRNSGVAWGIDPRTGRFFRTLSLFHYCLQKDIYQKINIFLKALPLCLYIIKIIMTVKSFCLFWEFPTATLVFLLFYSKF